MIRILHLSDFHFQEKTAWDSEPILEKLAQALRGVQGQQPVDVVVVTGDIAQSGKPVEYAIARQWFEQLLRILGDLPRERILFVPGNHDVNREKVSRAAKALQASFLQGSSVDQKAIAEVLADGDDQEVLLKRLVDYQAFVNHFQPRALPWWHQVLEMDAGRSG